MGIILRLDAGISLAVQLFDFKVKQVLWVPVTLWGLHVLQQTQLLYWGEALLFFQQLLHQAGSLVSADAVIEM